MSYSTNKCFFDTIKNKKVIGFDISNSQEIIIYLEDDYKLTLWLETMCCEYTCFYFKNSSFKKIIDKYIEKIDIELVYNLYSSNADVKNKNYQFKKENEDMFNIKYINKTTEVYCINIHDAQFYTLNNHNGYYPATMPIKLSKNKMDIAKTYLLD